MVESLYLYLHNRLRNYVAPQRVMHKQVALQVMYNTFGSMPKFIIKQIYQEMIDKELIVEHGKQNVKIINEAWSEEIDEKIKKNLCMW